MTLQDKSALGFLSLTSVLRLDGSLGVDVWKTNRAGSLKSQCIVGNASEKWHFKTLKLSIEISTDAILLIRQLQDAVGPDK